MTRSGRRRNRSSNSDRRRSATRPCTRPPRASRAGPASRRARRAPRRCCRRRSAASGSTFAARSVSAYSCADAISISPWREAVAEGPAGARQRLAVELLAVPPHRPREAMAARVPAHRLRELEPVDDRAQPLEQRLSAQRLPRHAGPQVAVPLLEVGLGEPVTLREAGRRLLSPLRRRPLHELLGGRLRQLVDDECDPPRAYIDVRCVHSQVATDELGKLTFGLPAGRGRQLLAAELKQQRRHRAARRRGAPPSA